MQWLSLKYFSNTRGYHRPAVERCNFDNFYIEFLDKNFWSRIWFKIS